VHRWRAVGSSPSAAQLLSVRQVAARSGARGSAGVLDRGRCAYDDDEERRSESPPPDWRNDGREVTQVGESDLIEKSYTHGSVNLALTIHPANRQATLKVSVSGDVTATATVQEGRPSDKVVSHRLPDSDLTLRLEAHKVTITGTLEDGPVRHEVALP
jgi:hypothetical protein